MHNLSAMIHLQACISSFFIQQDSLSSKCCEHKIIEENLLRPDATRIRQMDHLMDRVEEGPRTTRTQNEHKDKQMDIL